MVCVDGAKLKYCKYGHALTPENITLYYDKQRNRHREQCKECHRRGARNYYRRGTSKREDPPQMMSFEVWSTRRRQMWSL